MKRKLDENLGGSLYKRQRTDDNQYDKYSSEKPEITKTTKLDTSAWGVDDECDSSSDDDDIHNGGTTNNHNTNSSSTNNGHTINHNNLYSNGNNNSNSNTMMSGTVDPKEGPVYSSFAHKMMKSMGHVDGQSLGKTSGGIVEPIKAYDRIAQRGGLGFDSKIAIKPQTHQYEPEKIEIEIQTSWYKEGFSSNNKTDDNDDDDGKKESDVKLLTYSEFEKYMKFKPRCDRVGIEWNDTFCSLEIQREIFSKKSEFDEIGQTKLFMEARNKANPFEGIKREIFQNRAALKMCEIDKHLNYLLTQPYNGCCITFNKNCKIKQEKYLQDWKNGIFDTISIHQRDLWTRELIYFADLCSGPGGFTEYFLHINKWQCRGWGFTLKNNEDFKLNKFNSNAPWDNFTPEYGPKNNGDITCNENLLDFRKKVISVSMNGCHVVMADGGFDCFPDYNSQELLSRQLILCQFLCAMSILKKNGVFVCKLFDCFHPFTASVIYIACMCFEEVGLIKPNQSRPANSERYIICKGYKFGECNVWNKSSRTVHEPHYIVKHLYDINMIINKQKEEKQEVDRLTDMLNMTLNENGNNDENNDNNNNNNYEHKSNQLDRTQELRQEINEKSAMLKEVCPLVPIEEMPQSFKTWLKDFNESNGKRQIRHLVRIKKYLEDKNLKIDDQITIRKKALNYWFNTKDGHKFILLDPQYGCRYVTKYEDYNYQNNNNMNNNNNPYNDTQQNDYERPLSSLISNDELLRRIKFEFENCTSFVNQNEFSNRNQESDFKRYNIRGDWFCIAFEYKEHDEKYPPKWVTLISTGNRQIFECTRERNMNNELVCISKTNDLMRLPADTVIDCIKSHSCKTNQEIYHIFDAWIIGSKPLYKRNFIQRQEFCRVLYQGYGSKYLKFAGAMPALQSIKRDAIINRSNNICLWFIRNKKSIEQKEKKNPKTAKLSQYWRPCSVKLWNGASINHHRNNCLRFDKLLENMKYLNNNQMQQRKRQQQQQRHHQQHHQQQHHHHNNNNNGYNNHHNNGHRRY